MARSCDGVDDYLITASTIDLSAHQKATFSVWTWLNTGGSVSERIFASAVNGVPRYNLLYVDADARVWGEFVGTGGSPVNVAYATSPSTGAWHHYVLTIDVSKSSEEVENIYIDGGAASLTRTNDQNNTENFPNVLVALGAIKTSVSVEQFANIRVAEFAIWPNVILSSGDVASLYNSGNGRLATDVQGGSLGYYWRLLGDDSPEPATVGGISMTVNGATSTAHPFTIVNPDTGSYHTTRARVRHRVF